MQLKADVYAKFGIDNYIFPLSMDLLGPTLIILAAEAIILFVLNIAIELHWIQRAGNYIHEYILRTKSKDKTKTQNVQALDNGESEKCEIEDDDVAAERLRTETKYYQMDKDDTEILRIYKLTKVFKSGLPGNIFDFKAHKEKIAVNNISVGIQKGECFGWLGLNGAGKSTTFKILTDVLLPTYGEFEMSSETMAMGYCPQVDSLEPCIRTSALLHIYAMIKGIPSEHRPNVILQCLNDLDLVSGIFM